MLGTKAHVTQSWRPCEALARGTLGAASSQSWVQHLVQQSEPGLENLMTADYQDGTNEGEQTPGQQ
jgi:hypothetical protein